MLSPRRLITALTTTVYGFAALIGIVASLSMLWYLPILKAPTIAKAFLAVGSLATMIFFAATAMWGASWHKLGRGDVWCFLLGSAPFDVEEFEAWRWGRRALYLWLIVAGCMIVFTILTFW